MSKDSLPRSFLLTEPAWYSFKIQNVFPDIISFVSAIPIHLRGLFIIPIEASYAPISSERYVQIASRLAGARVADYIPTGLTPEQELFGTETFVNYDNENSHPDTSEGSIFDITDPYTRTKHQEYNFDQNIQTPTDTTYMSDVDMSEYFPYPYRLDAYPVRHSSKFQKNGSLVITKYYNSDKLLPWYDGLRDPIMSDGEEDHRTSDPLTGTPKRYPVYYNIKDRAQPCVVEPKPGSSESFNVSSTSSDVGFLERTFRVHCNLISPAKGARKYYKWTKHNPSGYDVTVLERINKNTKSAEFLVSCDCEFFKYTSYFGRMEGKSVKARRPLVCKHVYALFTNTTNDNYLLLTDRQFRMKPSEVQDPALKAALNWLNPPVETVKVEPGEPVVKKRKRIYD